MQLSLIQLVTTTAFNWATWGYALVQYSQASTFLTAPFSSELPTTIGVHPAKGGEIALIVIFLGFCLGWMFFTWKLYFVFGWSTYKEMGADLQFRHVLYLYHIYILLLKIDVFFFLGFDIQFLFLILAQTNSGILLNALVSFLGTFIALILAYYAVPTSHSHNIGPKRKQISHIHHPPRFYRCHWVSLFKTV